MQVVLQFCPLFHELESITVWEKFSSSCWNAGDSLPPCPILSFPREGRRQRCPAFQTNGIFQHRFSAKMPRIVHKSFPAHLKHENGPENIFIHLSAIIIGEKSIRMAAFMGLRKFLSIEAWFCKFIYNSCSTFSIFNADFAKLKVKIFEIKLIKFGHRLYNTSVCKLLNLRFGTVLSVFQQFVPLSHISL